MGIGVLRKSLETDWNKENGENSPCGGIVCHLDILGHTWTLGMNMDELKSWGLAKTMDSQWESIGDINCSRTSVQRSCSRWSLSSFKSSRRGSDCYVRWLLEQPDFPVRLDQQSLTPRNCVSSNWYEQTFQAGEISIAHRNLSRSDSIHACPIGLKT